MVVVMNQGRVMQVGKPEEIYHHPSNAFVAEFLGISNVLRGTVASDGKGMMVAGACVPFKATPGSAGIVVFKADEALIKAADKPSPPAELHPGGKAEVSPGQPVIFHGKLEEVFFIGSVYRHYVNVSGEMILVDSPNRVAQPDVRVCVPEDKIQVFV
jgi:ABC-type Fe3+/spermidine/putrescine transport system ATPase subunit